MDAELARYAEAKISADQGKNTNIINDDSQFVDDDETLGEESITSLEEKMTSFDARAAQESLTFIGDVWREIEELSQQRPSSMASTQAGYEVVWDSLPPQEDSGSTGEQDDIPVRNGLSMA